MLTKSKQSTVHPYTRRKTQLNLWITLAYDTARGGAEIPLDSTESTPEPEEPPSEDNPPIVGLPLTAHAQEELLFLNFHKLCITTLTQKFNKVKILTLCPSMQPSVGNY